MTEVGEIQLFRWKGNSSGAKETGDGGQKEGGKKRGFTDLINRRNQQKGKTKGFSANRSKGDVILKNSQKTGGIYGERSKAYLGGSNFSQR